MVRVPIRRPFLVIAVTLLPVLAWAQGPGIEPPTPPNLLLDVSRAFVSAAVERSVDRTEPVCDVILKTRITGTGHTVGRVERPAYPQ